MCENRKGTILYIQNQGLQDIEESEEVANGVVVDYSETGKVVGAEILNVKEKFTLEELSKLNVELPTLLTK